MATPEGVIKNSIMEYLSLLSDGMFWIHDSIGVFDPVKRCYRRRSKYHRNGVSDILGLYRGKSVAIEVKTPKGRLSPEQDLFLKDFASHGGIAIVARSREDVIEGIRNAFGAGNSACYTDSSNTDMEDG